MQLAKGTPRNPSSYGEWNAVPGNNGVISSLGSPNQRFPLRANPYWSCQVSRRKMRTRKSKVVIDVSVSLDGYVAGPGDDSSHPLGRRGGQHIFDWLFRGDRPYRGTMFKPKKENRPVLEKMFDHAGAMLTGRRTYDIASGWGGEHPIKAIPIVILTHNPPAIYPRGRSKLVFVTDGIESAVSRAKLLAGEGDVGIGGASVAQQALDAGLVDEIRLHVAPILLGGGVRLFGHLGDEPKPLKLIDVLHTEDAVHLHYRVLRKARRRPMARDAPVRRARTKGTRKATAAS